MQLFTFIALGFFETILDTWQQQGLRDKEVWQFTHEDVKNGVVHFVVNPDLLKQIRSTLNPPLLNDSFEYRLVAPGVQPANGRFRFTLKFPVRNRNFF